MKQNNKFNKFGRNNHPEKNSTCSCGGRTKLKINKNYPFGKKSKAVTSKYYKCDKCGETRFVSEKQNAKKR
jgi:hypothetical protein